MTAKLIAFPRQCNIPSSAIEDEIERLIALLDERQAACDDLEPDPDLEDVGEAETASWPDISTAKVVSIRSRPKSETLQRKRSEFTSSRYK